METSSYDFVDCCIRSIRRFRKYPWVLDKDQESDAIKLIKCTGNHIGDYEASIILSMLRKLPEFSK